MYVAHSLSKKRVQLSGGWDAGKPEDQEKKVKLEIRLHTFELKRIASQKLWMKQSFFPHSTFRIPTFILLFLITASGTLWGMEAKTVDTGTLAASLDRVSVPVGGVVWLTLDYRLPEGGRLPEKTEIKGLDGLSRLKQIIDPGQVRIQLLVDHLGPWQSEPISLAYLDANDQTQLLTAPPVSLQAVSNLGEKADEAELRPIHDIVAVRSLWQRYLLWLAVAVGLVVIGLGWFWCRTHTDGGVSSIPEKLHPPLKAPMSTLQSLKAGRQGEMS